MGEEKWTRRKTGSISGSMVPPPAGDEGAPGKSPLPKRPAGRKPERIAQAGPSQPALIRRASGSPPPDQRAVIAAESPSLPSGPAAAGQPRLYVAARSAADPQPQVPDNVRYLFKPILTQAVPAEDWDELEYDLDQDELPAAGGDAAGSAEQAAIAQGGDQGLPAGQERPKRASVLAATGTHRRTESLEPDGTIPAGAVSRVRLRRRLSWAAAIVLVLATALGTTLTLLGGRSSAGNARQANAGVTPFTAGAKAITGLSKAGIVRSRAAQWVFREVSRSVIIACDAVMCSQLFNAGIPASNLLVLGPSAADPLGADLVIGTPAVRSQFGARLSLEYAPAVLASFGAGKLKVDVRIVAPQGARLYELALNRDIAARQRGGSQLLRNSQIAVSAPAQPALIAGLVDPRLLVMLPVLATQHPIQIVSFYDRAPRSGRGIPLCGVELAAADSSSGLSATGYRRWLLSFLRSQRAPFRATSITTAHLHGRDVVLVRFARPSPVGLLNSAIGGGHAY